MPIQCRSVKLGEVYGRLLVVSRAVDTPDGRPTFTCQCTCGIKKVIRAGALRSGNTKSCGCLHIEWSKKWAPSMVRDYRQKPAGVSALRAAFCATRQSAKRRQLDFSFTLEEFKTISSCSCHYCDSPPSNLSKTAGGVYTWNGVDRVDSKKGYVLENAVPCCKICNRAKGDMTLAEFERWIARVYKRYEARQN